MVHLWAVEGNTDPLEMKSIDGPAAALVGTEVTFTASPSGGVGEYKFQWIIDGTEKGTSASQTYTVPNDPQKVAVKCTVTDEDDNEASKQIDFWQVKITLERDGTEIPSSPPAVWAGEQMNLEAVVEPSDVEVTSPEWDIPGQVVKDYICTESQGKVESLGNSDLHSKTISFYWVDGTPIGISKEVDFCATIAGETVATSASITLHKPEVFFSVSSPGVVECNTQYYACQPGYIALHFGESEEFPGYEIWPSSLFSHECRWVQLKDCRRVIDFSAYVRIIDSVGFDFMSNMTWFWDAPGQVQLWAPTVQMTADDHYAATFLYRPSEDGIYVPICSVTWGWYGNGYRDTRWSLLEGYQQEFYGPFEDSQHPQW